MQRLYDGRPHGSTIPWWVLETPFDPPAPPLEGHAEADVAIVGGGFTGMWTALSVLERRPGASVVLLEADRCGAGASARNGGFLHGYWSSLARLVALLGPEAALQVAREADGAIAAVRALGEDVWLEEGGMLLVSTSPAEDERIRRAVEAAEALGVPEEAVPLDAALARERLRSPAFRAGVLFRDGATVQPARLVRALRRAVVAAGVRLYEGTPVLRVESGRVHTARARLAAEEIVVATNASAAHWRPTATRLAVFESAVVLTEPIAALAELVGWGRGEAVIDGRTFLDYFRRTVDGRILMGSATGSVERAYEALLRLLPAVAHVPVAHSWKGAIDVSSDRLPSFYTIPGTRIHVGAGYSGNGVGPSWLGGRLLASLVLGAPPDSPLVCRSVPRLPPQPLRLLATPLVRRAMLAVDDAEAAGRRAPALARLVAGAPAALGLTIATR